MDHHRESLLAKLNIRPGEGVPLALLLAHSFLNGLSAVFLDTAASSFFLARYGAVMLPYVYLGTAVLSVIIGLVYARVEARVHPRILLTGVLAFLVVLFGLLPALAAGLIEGPVGRLLADLAGGG